MNSSEQSNSTQYPGTVSKADTESPLESPPDTSRREPEKGSEPISGQSPTATAQSKTHNNRDNARATPDNIPDDSAQDGRSTNPERASGSINKDRLDPTRYGDWEKNGRCIDF